MPKKRDVATFKDFAAEPTWSEMGRPPSGMHAVRPGGFNSAGELFDPSATLVARTGEVTPAQAQALVDSGASVAYEGCGCGGWGGCAPQWPSDEMLAELRGGPKPRFVKGFGSPTWLDVWEGEGSTVVFAHGDVTWGRWLT